jgi:hypothetical protein
MKSFSNQFQFRVCLLLSLLLLVACLKPVHAQNISFSVGTGLAKSRPYPSKKRFSFQACLEKKTLFGVDWVSVTPFVGYAQYIYDFGDVYESVFLKYHVLTLGNAVSIYPLELYDAEKYGEKRYRVYASLSVAYDWIFIPGADFGLNYTNSYLGGFIGGRYGLTDRLSVYAELGKTPSGILGAGFNLKL